MTTGAGANLSQGHTCAFRPCAGVSLRSTVPNLYSGKQPNPIRTTITTLHAGMPAEVAIEVKEVAWHSVATPEEVLQALQSSKEGLSSEEAEKRLAQ